MQLVLLVKQELANVQIVQHQQFVLLDTIYKVLIVLLLQQVHC